MNIDSIEGSVTLQCGKNASSIMLIPRVVSAGFETSEITAELGSAAEASRDR